MNTSAAPSVSDPSPKAVRSALFAPVGGSGGVGGATEVVTLNVVVEPPVVVVEFAIVVVVEPCVVVVVACVVVVVAWVVVVVTCWPTHTCDRLKRSGVEPVPVAEPDASDVTV